MKLSTSNDASVAIETSRWTPVRTPGVKTIAVQWCEGANDDRGERSRATPTVVSRGLERIVS